MTSHHGNKPMSLSGKSALAVLMAASLFAGGCDAVGREAGNDTTAVDEGADHHVAAPDAESVEIPAQDGLVRPSSWMPADWDQNVHSRSGESLSPESLLKSRQNVLSTVPFILWAVANDTLVTEAFEPIWVWYAAIRSCDRGIQMSEDLAGEFGNRERGRTALTQTRNELRAWAAQQPPEMTLYFTANLGQWNEASGAFPLRQVGKATTLNPHDVASIDPYFDGARVELWTDRSGQAINHFQASLAAPQCVSQDGSKIYKFERMSQWWVVFGDADRGMGGLTNYRSREMLPPIAMTREDAGALAERNAQREVVVAVTFVPLGSSFVRGIDQSAIRARFRHVEVTDALNGSVLVSKSY